MNRNRLTPRTRSSAERFTRACALCGLAMVSLLFLPETGLAQIQDSDIDTLYVDTIGVPVGSFDAGDTIWVPVGVQNTFVVGGMGYRLECDTAKIRPAYTTDASSYPIVNRLVGRGLVFNKPAAVTSVVIRHPDTANIITGLLVDFEGTASIATGRGAVIELAFVCKSGISTGQNVVVRVRDDLTKPIEPRNNISDVTGTLAVYPRLRNGQILFGGTVNPPGNNAPVITIAPPTLAYGIKQGQTVAFSASADDPDTTNDQVTLSVALPSGATFVPSNPVVGVDQVSGSFSWTPNFSQEGLFNVTVNASDNHGGSSNKTVAITVEKQDIDILFTTSADNDKPVGGIPGKTGVLLPIDVLASRDIYGVQFDLVLDGSAFRVDSIIPTAKLTNFTLWDNIGLNADTTRIITFSIAGDSMPLASGTTIMNVAVTIDTASVPGRYPVTFLRALEAITPDPDQGSIEMFVENGSIYVDKMGDVNLDQSRDVADMVSLTGYILGRVTLSPRQFDVSDINGDSSADVIDLVAIINDVLGFDTLAVPIHPVFEGGEAEFYLTYGGQTGDQAIYFVEGYMPTNVAGMELDFTYDFNQIEPYAPTRTGQAAGLNVQSVRDAGHMKIVAYYNANISNAVPPGHGRYFVLPVKVKQPLDDPATAPFHLKSATVSDPDAAKVRVKGIDQPPVLPESFRLYQNFPNPFNPETTIKFEIGSAAGSSVALDVYNVLGQHVKRIAHADLPAGEYNVVWNGTDKFDARVASGVYFYRLQVGDKVETKKMVLLK